MVGSESSPRFIRGRLDFLSYSAKLVDSNIVRLVITIPGTDSWWEDIIYHAKDGVVLVDKMRDNMLLSRVVDEIKARVRTRSAF